MSCKNESPKNAEEISANDTLKVLDEKPNVCDCQNSLWKDMEEALDNGDEKSSDFSQKCEQFYTIDELIYAECGLDEYEPNFKAKNEKY